MPLPSRFGRAEDRPGSCRRHPCRSAPEATIRPISVSVARCSTLQARRHLVLCFSLSHSPGSQSFRPVPSTSRCSDALPAFGRGSPSVSARRLRVLWSGTGDRGRAVAGGSRSASQSGAAPSETRLAMSGLWRLPRPNTTAARPRVMRGAAVHTAIAASVNQIVRLPRWRRAASYAAQFVTLCCCFGMWWRQVALALNGTAGIQASGKRPPSYIAKFPTSMGRPVQQGAVETDIHRLAGDRWQTRQNPCTFVHGGRELRCLRMIRLQRPNYAPNQWLVMLPPTSSCSPVNPDSPDDFAVS